jgi:hypothetical protein
MSLDLSGLATNLLTDLGSSDYVKIVRETGATFDPVEGQITGGTTTDIDCVGIVVKITDSLQNDSRVQAGDKMVLIDKAQTPKMTDRIKFNGKAYQIVLIDGFNHAGIQQFWKVVCRG